MTKNLLANQGRLCKRFLILRKQKYGLESKHRKRNG
jgi:hypothetical protein